MSKKEKRLKRIAEKQERDQEKKAKLIATIAPQKLPSIQKRISPSKMPKEHPKHSILDDYMEWSREMEDLKGKWSWGDERDWGNIVWNTIIEPHLRNYESKKWKEIISETFKNRRRKHFPYKIKIDLIKEVYKRLIYLKFDDHEEIFRFNLSGKKRLYGFRIGATFGTVWYDPEHRFYKSKK